ncbi:carbohydrate ABC transporter permease [Xylanimonas cellulosilytica]|nr:sugar ABC transporter permease [Xylanimonas cellulosilytica]
MTDSMTRPRAESVAAPETPRAPRSPRQRWARFSFKATPYVYTSPFFIVFAIVGLFPMGFTLFVSLYDWKMTTQSAAGATFVGLGNYTSVLQDTLFWQAMGNTVSIFLLSTIPQIIVATFLATMLDRNLKAKTFWRMGVLVPYVVAPVSIAIIFSAIFADPIRGGLANAILDLIGVDPLQWKSNQPLSHISIATMVNFRWTGYNTLLLLAAMQSVPRELYEAAALDGAGAWRRFTSVTLPSIRTTMVFVIITATMGGLRIFDEPKMFDASSTSTGGPGGIFRTVVLYLYETGFGSQNRLGRAAAIAWVLFFFILLVTGLNYWLSSRISDDRVGKLTRKQKRQRRRTEVAR